MYVKKDGKWMLIGIVSASLSKDACDLDKYTIFTDVGKHEKWITENTL